MRKICCFVIAIGFALTGFSQGLYDEKRDANKQLDEAIAQAKAENKFVMVQVGGNWCRWCLMFNDFVTKNDSINKVLISNFVFIHLNYSPANKNEQTMKYLGNPQRFGFPVLVILDDKGQRIHTQNSAYLEEGNNYSEKQILQFLHHWTPTACGVK